jgi:hypothetical protein
MEFSLVFRIFEGIYERELRNINMKPYPRHETNSQYFCVRDAMHLTLYYNSWPVFQNVFPPDPIHQAEGRFVAVITLTNT